MTHIYNLHNLIHSQFTQFNSLYIYNLHIVRFNYHLQIMSSDHPSLKKHKGVKSASLIGSIKSSSPIVNAQSSTNVTLQIDID